MGKKQVVSEAQVLLSGRTVVFCGTIPVVRAVGLRFRDGRDGSFLRAGSRTVALGPPSVSWSFIIFMNLFG